MNREAVHSEPNFDRMSSIFFSLCLLFQTTQLVLAAPATLSTERLAVYPNEVTGSTAIGSYRLFQLTVLHQSITLNVSLNSFHHSIDTTCQFYSGQVTNDEATSDKYLGWTTISLCNKSLTGIITMNGNTYTIEPAQSNSNAHVLRRHNSPAANTDHDCSTNVPGNQPQIVRLKRHEHTVLEKTIELAVYVDKSLSDLHQDKLQTYTLHIMNTVAHLFKDASIGYSNIEIALVNVTVLNNTKISGDTPAAAKDNFCKWQAKERETATNQHDMAVLLTRESICESDTNCAILGITNYRSVCDKDKSCAVIKDTGLSTAFTVAHELGHSLGVYHDGDRNVNCKSPAGQYLMSASFQQSSNPHKWSSCSSEQIYDFLSSSDSICLDNTPASTVAPPPSAAPLIGTQYTLDKQCQLLFGQSATSCHKTNCSVLWCSVTEGGSCDRTQHSPPAGGSTCLLSNGTQGVCYHGNCRGYGEVSQPIDGQWSQWSSWSACSSSCGSGVQSKVRQCNSPKPQYGGKPCTGKNMQYRLCTNPKCTADYRQARCSTLGRGITVGSSSGNRKWIAADTGDIVHFKLNSCQLYCQLSGDNALFLFENTLPQGTSCLTHRSTAGVCISDHCVEIGCNGILGTPYYTDKCGVMCGDNSSCSDVSLSFTPTLGSAGEYQVMFTLPTGARNIAIDETSPSTNLIAAYGGSFQLNGPANRPFHYRHAQFAGALWDYSTDRVSTAGPITEPVTVKVYVTDRQSRGSYSIKYIIRNSDSQWSVGNWSTCSVACGNGTRTRNVTCTHGQCDQQTRPVSTAPCTLEPCDHFRWVAGSWSQCSVTCGGGQQVRSVSCQHINGTDVDDKYCTAQQSKPVKQQICSTESCGCTDQYTATTCQYILQYNMCSMYRAHCCNTCGQKR